MKTTTTWLAVGLATIFSGIAIGADFRTFTDTQGRKLEAKATKLTADAVVVKMKNGRSATLPITSLSPDDQEYLKKFEAEQAKSYDPSLEITFKSGKGDRRTETYFDERTLEVEPGVSIENRDLGFTVKGAKATVMTFGKHVTIRGELKVFSKETFEFSVEPGQTAEWTGKQFRVEYDDKNSYRYGHRYAGYLVVVQNADGRITNVAGTNTFEDRAELALKLKTGQLTDRDLRPKDS